MDELQTFISELQLDYPIFQGMVALTLLIIGLVMAWQPFVRASRYFRLRKLIQKQGMDVLHDVYLPGGIDGRIYVENLLLTPQGLQVIHVKPYYGTIFAAEQIDYWTQVIGHHSFKFNNPLHQLQVTIGELREIFPKTSIEGRVLFTPGCRFPKGKPENVVLLDELKHSHEHNETIMAGLRELWDVAIQKAEPARQQNLAIYLRKNDKKYFTLSVILMAVAVGWIGWLLIQVLG